MKQTILLFHFTDRERRSRLTRALLPLKFKIRQVAKEEYQNSIGYLAGSKNLAPAQEKYTGDELEGEMLIMAGLSSKEVDQVITNIKKSGVGPIPYKAVVTPVNQSWTVPELFAEIQKEHEQMKYKV